MGEYDSFSPSLREKVRSSFEEFCEARRLEILRARPEWAGTEFDHPGGASRTAFDKFAKSFREGDEIWSFSSDEASWERLMGSAGYAIVRDGRIVEVIIDIMN